MNNPPSIIRSRWLSELCERRGLTDPYRLANQDVRDFTFIPRTGRQHRSRLDFFLISDNILDDISKCEINSGLTTTLFDHKSIVLPFSKKEFKSRFNVKNSTINNYRFMSIVSATVAESHLHHADPAQPGLNIEAGLQHVGEIKQLIRYLNDTEWDRVSTGQNLLIPDPVLDPVKERLKMLTDNLPDPAELNAIRLTVDHDLFLRF
jgi:hypothetical protein